jgi:hypothetical protein
MLDSDSRLLHWLSGVKNRMRRRAILIAEEMVKARVVRPDCKCRGRDEFTAERIVQLPCFQASHCRGEAALKLEPYTMATINRSTLS